MPRHRATDIADYVSYLDTLYEHVRATVPAPAARVHVLGFSQGAATASRWAALGRSVIDRLILWGGAHAHDLPPTGARAPARDSHGGRGGHP